MKFQLELIKSLKENGKRLAIHDNNRSLIYEDVLYMANSITRSLIENKVEKGSVIGILVNDIPDLICSIIGILNTGCIFVPIDASLPEKRLASIIKDINLQIIIVSKRTNYQNNLEREFDLKKYYFEDIACKYKCLELNDHDYPEFGEDDSIYIYFTSGSTGYPKGIIGKNCSLLQFITWEVKYFILDSNYRFSQFISPYFDAFLRDVFVPLFVGGAIYIPPKEKDFYSPAKITNWIDENKINLIHCVPSLFRLINNDVISTENFKNLKYVLLSGEKIISSELKNWYKLFGSGIKLFNLYGTTETTMIRSCYEIKPDDSELGKIPIGKPIDNTELLVLNSSLHPCNMLVTGDLYIQSKFVTKGYLNLPELTHESFLKLPQNTQNNDIAFRTGDKARLLPHKVVDLLGREDRQIKLRGIRIELDEIEYQCTKEINFIKNVSVIHLEASETNFILVAFVVLKDQNQNTNEIESRIKNKLQTILPEYSVPSKIIIIEQFPLLESGKIDYEKLKQSYKESGSQNDLSSRNNIEVKLALIWQSIFELKTINDIRVDYFSIGGNSLNIMALISRIYKEFGVRVSLSDIFKAPTIKKQAILIQRSGIESYKAIKPVEKKEYYQLSSAQRRLFAINQFSPASINYNIPLIVSVKGKFEISRLHQIVKKIVSRHDALKTYSMIINGLPVQRLTDNINITIEKYDLTNQTLEDIIGSFIRPFDLSKAPLFRMGIAEGNGAVFLLFDFHHIIADNKTLTILVNDFNGILAGNELPNLKIQYKDFALWHNKLQLSEKLKEQENYWTSKFSDNIPTLDLPLDFERPDVKKFDGDQIEFILDENTSNEIFQFINENNVTLYMFFLSVTTILLSKYSGQTDIIIGTPIEGRNHPDLNNIIGMFVGQLAMRNTPMPDLSFDVFLEEVKNNTLQAFDSQDYQYDELTRKLKLHGDTKRNPLFDVVLAIFNNFDAEKNNYQDLGDLIFAPYPVPNKTCKTDLRFAIIEEKNNITVTLTFATSLFKKETCSVMLEDFISIVKQILKDKQIKISGINISKGLKKINTTIQNEVFDFGLE